MLGPLEARRGNRPLRLGGPRQKLLLAVLLLHAREPLSSDRLIDALWGEHPPADAQTALHAHVSRIRKALCQPDVLVTRRPGYALEIGDEQLDLRRFEQLAAEGRALLAADAPERAATALRDALDLWRGRPLADLEDEPFAAALVPGLKEAHLEARETRIEADLARGLDTALVPELDALVRRHPLRERPRAQLMIALHRSGRQADALEAYDEGRRRLADELGLEPGNRLRRLHAEILADPRASDPEPRRPEVSTHRGRRSYVAAAVLAVLAVLGAGVAAVAGRDDAPRAPAERAATAAGAALVRLDPRTGAVLRTVRAGGEPGAVAAGAGAVWSIDVDGQTIASVDPRSGAAATFATGATPVDLAVGAGALWVAGGAPVGGRRPPVGSPRRWRESTVGRVRWRSVRDADRARAHPPPPVRRRDDRAGRGPRRGRAGRRVGDRPRLLLVRSIPGPTGSSRRSADCARVRGRRRRRVGARRGRHDRPDRSLRNRDPRRRARTGPPVVGLGACRGRRLGVGERAGGRRDLARPAGPAVGDAHDRRRPRGRRRRVRRRVPGRANRCAARWRRSIRRRPRHAHGAPWRRAGPSRRALTASGSRWAGIAPGRPRTGAPACPCTTIAPRASTAAAGDRTG